MGFLKKLFGDKGNETRAPQQAPLVEGDIFYSVYKGEYHIHKLLRIDDEGTTFHVMGYKPVKYIPTVDRLPDLEVYVQHFPIDSKGFTDPVVIVNMPVTEEDLEGLLLLPGDDTG